MTKGVDERIDEGVLRGFIYVERIENDRIAKRVYVGECAGIRLVSRPRKRWTDTMKDCLRKRDLDVSEGEGCRIRVNGGGEVDLVLRISMLRTLSCTP